MLINFSVQNFGSIKDKQTLSFEADKSQHLEDYYVIHTNGLRLLKLALIYGANASGKTTVLNALDFFRTLVVEPEMQKTQSLNFEPFLFDPHTSKQNTIFEIDFIQNNIRYLYEIELNKQFIARESLSYAKKPNSLKNIVNVFIRTTDQEKQLSNIVFDPALAIDSVALKILTINTLWNNVIFGGFLKTNIEQNNLTDTMKWFSDYLSPIIQTNSSLDAYVLECIKKKTIDKVNILKMLKKADFNLSDILIEYESHDSISEELLEVLKKRANVKDDIMQELKNADKITMLALDFEHNVKGRSYLLSFRQESQGTQRYFGLAGLLCLLIKESNALLIDELESSLHPDLFQHFLLSFLVNSKKSQIIATTHNREILNNKEIFRNDAIWITDKDNEECATELYSLADFDSSVIRNTTNVLNAYKLGKLGGTPNLGSYYINIEDESE